MTKARYQPIIKDQIPVVTLPFNRTGTDSDVELGTVRLIAGGTEVFGDTNKGAAKTFSPGKINMNHVFSGQIFFYISV